MNFDILIIGGGPAGLVASKLAAGLGKKVALFEKERLGGDCTLTGCIPSKTLVAIANAVYSTRTLERYKVNVDVTHLDTSKIMDHVRTIVEEIYQGHTPELLQKLGITVIHGTASFKDQYTVTCESIDYTAPKIIIAAGAYPSIPPIEGIHDVPYLTNKNIFSLRSLPSSLIILGGGPIAVELGTCLQKLGTQITIIERSPTLLSHADHEMIPLVNKTLQDMGVIIKTGISVMKVLQTPEGTTVECVDSLRTKQSLTAERLLVAVGRIPNLEGLGLDKAGVQTTPKGIVVDDTLRTTAKNIYACGDSVGPYLLSHMAEYQASIATRNALIPFFKQKIDYNQAVRVTFTDPELASFGLTELDARKSYGDTLQIYRSYYKNCDRPRTDSTTNGMAKIICDHSGYIVGAHIYGARAGELIGELHTTRLYGKKLKDIYKVVHPYLTYTDIIWQPAKKAYIYSLKTNLFLKVLRSLVGFTKRN